MKRLVSFVPSRDVGLITYWNFMKNSSIVICSIQSVFLFSGIQAIGFTEIERLPVLWMCRLKEFQILYL